MTTEELIKPPPLIIGAQGVNAAAIGPGPKRPAPQRIAGLPAFQMFAAERRRDPRAMVNETSTLDEYEAWHAAKGYWPNETPWGELLEKSA